MIRSIQDQIAPLRGPIEKLSNFREQTQNLYDAIYKPAVQAGLEFARQNREPILAFIDGMQHLETEYRRDWVDSGYGYIFGPLEFAEILGLALHAESGNESELFDFLEDALTTPVFVGEISQLLHQSSQLSDATTLSLDHGLDHLEAREFGLAWAPLIIGLEGAFSDVRIARGIDVRIGNEIYVTDEFGNATSKKPQSVEGKIRSLQVDPDLQTFLIQKVYGGVGNSFRHGGAVEGFRDQTLRLVMGVVGWLETFATPGAWATFKDAVLTELERRDRL